MQAKCREESSGFGAFHCWTCPDDSGSEQGQDLCSTSSRFGLSGRHWCSCAMFIKRNGTQRWWNLPQHAQLTYLVRFVKFCEASQTTDMLGGGLARVGGTFQSCKKVGVQTLLRLYTAGTQMDLVELGGVAQQYQQINCCGLRVKNYASWLQHSKSGKNING